MDTNTRKAALAKHLDMDTSDFAAVDAAIERAPHWGEPYLYAEGGTFLVVSDAEADTMAMESAKEALWAFTASFLSRFVPALQDDRAAKAWEKVACKLCDDANPLAEALLGDRLDEALSEAVREDGRAHFLNTYDNTEHEVRVDGALFYVYRVN